MTVLLTRKSVVQAALETVYKQPAAVGVNDGLLVNNPMFSIRPNVLERNFVRNDLSPMPIIIGRKIATMEFETELRGNGLENSGLISDAPMIARLFQGCGYAINGFRSATTIGPFSLGDEANNVAWAIGSGANASQTFTSTGNFVDGDTVQIGSVTYTMKTAIAAHNHVLIGANAAASLVNLVKAAMGQTGAGLNYFAGTDKVSTDLTVTSTATTLVVTANEPGTLRQLDRHRLHGGRLLGRRFGRGDARCGREHRLQHRRHLLLPDLHRGRRVRHGSDRGRPRTSSARPMRRRS